MTRSERPDRQAAGNRAAQGNPQARTGRRPGQDSGGSRPGRSRGGRRTGRPTTSRTPAAPQGGDFALPETRTPALPAVAAFAELELPEPLLTALAAEGMAEPFPIQAATLPNSLAGRDILGRGRTGSGKTLAFGLALLARTAGRRAEAGAPLALVLVPTRELAQQVTDALTPYAKALGLRMATVVGGLSLNKQASALRRGTEVVVATPGRLKDLLDRGDCRLDQVAVSVLDEADQMTDMGFMPQVTALLDRTAPDGQRMLFSATLDRNIDRLVRGYLSDPVVHSVDPSAGAVTTMEHHVLYVADDTDKKAVALRIAARDGRVIMFVDTKRSADRFAKRLLANGVRASALHGGRSQPQRNRTLEQFKNGQVTALVATNVAARGIHVDDLDLVVNVDPPTDHKDYLHRGGRTARAGESGSVVTLVLPEEKREMTRLMSAARITPQTARVKSSDEELARLTGAREPSGVPVTVEIPQQPTPPKAKSGGRSRRGRSGGGRPSATATGRTATQPGTGGRTAAGAGTARTGGGARTGGTGRGSAGRAGGGTGRGAAPARGTGGGPRRARGGGRGSGAAA
ncbi:DEAD/DEAH box helicase [Streptomyces albidoflavus]|uniref:DEAD/DEAH box helicase n=1 Tax=Streptomyces albidoflavus TaxID=1886 RepID=UPI00101F27ED|nr:DEAD/DEAH box helicase [Streptomyces albidoflavus]RZF05724.1 DEAD/DEAH box helicase [Streptomyces albidoflavus]